MNFILFAHCSICDLYNWRYKKLGNLPHIQLYPEFRVANAGFFFDFQLVDVGDFNGVGETEPSPFFYQVRSKELSFCFCDNSFSASWKINLSHLPGYILLLESG